MGLSGVQRIAKFVKYLPAYHWQPTVLTVDPAGYYAYDESLLDELQHPDIRIVRTESRDPTRLFRKQQTVPMPGEGTRRLLSALSQFFFIPDNKIGWKRPAVELGQRVLEEAPYDVIFATAPPYTSLLVGLELSRISGVPLVTDFRDDWLGNPRHRYPTPLHRYRHRMLERSVIEHSVHVTTINRPIQDALLMRNLGASGYQRVSVIPHGYDAEDFRLTPAARPEPTCRFLYSGVFYDAQQPDAFLEALARVFERRPELREPIEAHFVGLLPERARRLVSTLNLDDQVTAHGYLPHQETVAHLLAADVLWMTVGRQPGEASISTSKLYEYIGTRKPILGLVPDGTAATTLTEYGAGFIAPPDDVETITHTIESLYERWLMNQLPRPDETFVRSFDRRQLTGDLAKLFLSTLKLE